MISKEQAEQIKSQLLEQIKTTFPDEKKQEAVEQLQEMNEEQLEQFLVQNNLIKSSPGQSTNSSASQGSQQCIFCSISNGSIESYPIDENKKAVAVLEINPVSKGHTIIIPREHIEKQSDMPTQALTLSKKISKKIQSKLKPKTTKIEFSNFMGHEIINVIPVYENESLNSKKQQATPKDLKELQETLKQKPKPKVIKKKPTKKLQSKKTEKLWLPKRIP